MLSHPEIKAELGQYCHKSVTSGGILPWNLRREHRSHFWVSGCARVSASHSQLPQ